MFFMCRDYAKNGLKYENTIKYMNLHIFMQKKNDDDRMRKDEQ